jgi:hypothetical protein
MTAPGHAVTGPTGAEREVLEQLRRALGNDSGILDSHIVEVAANEPPWQTTDIRLERGQRVSTFAVGTVTPVPGLDIQLGPAFQLWGRVGGTGPIFRGTRATNTFTAAADGPLELASYFPGEWADEDGGLGVPTEAYSYATGGLGVLVVRWAPDADPATALRPHGGEPSGLVDIELDRLGGTVAPPEGWRYLWYLGDSEIFSASTDPSASTGHPGSVINCHTSDDVGILQHDVDLPLTDATKIRWDWRFDELPSARAEDTLATHDYISLAVEFDNGQDLSWYWSSSLPVGHSYRCPIPTWAAKETHLVLRSGTTALHSWLTEERPVRSDYAGAIGPPPERIVRVWLIAVTLFQRGTGHGAFRDIIVTDGARDIRIQP